MKECTDEILQRPFNDSFSDSRLHRDDFHPFGHLDSPYFNGGSFAFKLEGDREQRGVPVA